MIIFTQIKGRQLILTEKSVNLPQFDVKITRNCNINRRINCIVCITRENFSQKQIFYMFLLNYYLFPTNIV